MVSQKADVPSKPISDIKTQRIITFFIFFYVLKRTNWTVSVVDRG